MRYYGIEHFPDGSCRRFQTPIDEENEWIARISYKYSQHRYQYPFLPSREEILCDIASKHCRR